MMYAYPYKDDGNLGLTRLSGIIQMYIKPEWFESQLIRDAMFDIEHVYKIEGLAFYSSDFGVKSPESLSNGMKALLIWANIPMDSPAFEYGYVSSALIGDNVAPYVQKLSLEKDFAVKVDNYALYRDDVPMLVKDVETGIVYNNARKYKDSIPTY